TATTIGIDMGGATNNGAANQAVAAITLDASANRDITLQNASTTTAGTLTLNGRSGLLLANLAAARTLTLRDGTSRAMTLALGNSGTIEVQNATSTIAISSAITGVGKSLNKAGAGLLTLSGNNIYTGGTNVYGGK